MRTPTKFPAILGVLAAAWGAAAADTITVNRLPRPNVRFVDASGGKITYELQGRNLESPLAQVGLIQLGGQNDFNKAENDAQAGKFAEAVAAYDKAAETAAGTPALLRLIRYRRLAALKAEGLAGRAVEDWLTIVEECSASRASLDLSPMKPAAKGSPENARAIELLEGRLPEAKDAALKAKLRQLLAAFQAVEGRRPAAGAGTPAGPAAESPVAPAIGPGDTPALSGSVSGALKQAADQFQSGQYAAAADGIKERLRKFDERELPAALVLRGKALLMLYDKGAAKKRETLLEAGLSFMRASACFDSSSPDIAEPTYWAAQVCQRLGNQVAARNAYAMITDRFSGTEWAKRAEEAIGALGGAPVGPGMGNE